MSEDFVFYRVKMNKDVMPLYKKKKTKVTNTRKNECKFATPTTKRPDTEKFIKLLE